MAEFESLAGRVYAITGASRGMGLRFARALVAEGAHVAILARPSDALDAATAEFARSLVLACDVGRSDQVKAAFAAIGARHGALHGLINNAAACSPHTLEQSTDAEIWAEINANLAGPMFCVREAVPLLRAAGGGDIVSISTDSVPWPFPYLSVYAATKAGLEKLSEALRAELKPDGIRVTTLRSGHVGGSSLGSGWAPERAKAFLAAMQASGHAAFSGPAMAPETMAAMLVRILSLPREANLHLVDMRSFQPVC